MDEEFPPSESRLRLENFIQPRVDAAREAIVNARGGLEQAIASPISALMSRDYSDAGILARRAAADPAWDARLRAQSAARAAARDPAQPDFMQKFVNLLMQLRNAPPQQPGGIPGVNGAPVQNPAPSQTPPPVIGGVRS